MASLTCFQAILGRKLHQHYRLFVSEVVKCKAQEGYSYFATLQPGKQDMDYK